jgi:hypothetical protein
MPEHTYKQFQAHYKPSAAADNALQAFLQAHLDVNGPAATIVIYTDLGSLLARLGSPGSEVRAKFNAYLAAIDADFLAASTSFDKANAYATAAMQDDADV